MAYSKMTQIVEEKKKKKATDRLKCNKSVLALHAVSRLNDNKENQKVIFDHFCRPMSEEIIIIQPNK